MHWDVAIAPLKIVGEENKARFLQYLHKMMKSKIEFPRITGKHQEEIEHWITRGREYAAAKGLPEGTLDAGGSLQYSMLGYEALLNEMQRKKLDNETLLL